ncbi:DUF4303 domain-containing protein [Montanilutibacter psychrotolerans]|uniref:DUF4303 domain-containing protein n=1 Tax=Montanilutibacter psychrotolerans TaxID=1327343 RepID=A0A3M8T1K3_9GAMM|nr:DUF4303 domain-containing protein [Lysobacter psychrotolerans]RNF84990.1 DUF4303 domain-containing protein [Lysobacter psychrotolerans]
MQDPLDFGTLRLATRDEIVRTLGIARQRHPDDRIAGYALVTDDAVATISYVFCLQSQLAGDDDPLRFDAGSWQLGGEAGSFASTWQWLAIRKAGERQGDRRQNWDRSFDALVQALHEVKAAGLVDDRVFLSVHNHEACAHMQWKEHDAIARLNAPHLLQCHPRFVDALLNGLE